MTLKTPISVAVMGCIVNGPGEAEDADLGIVGVNGRFVLYRRGEMIGKNLTRREALKGLRTELTASGDAR